MATVTKGKLMTRHNMKQLNVAEAKAKFYALVDAAARGHGAIIGKSGTPVAMLVPFDTGKRTPIKYGTLKGKIWIAENFHDPLPDDVLDAFARPTLKELLLADEPRAEIPFARRDRHHRRIRRNPFSNDPG
jgi:prevent-host-death family protein